MAVPQWLQHFLARYEIPYKVAQHAPAHSASRLAQATHLTGYRVAKTVLVSADSRPVMAVLPAARHLDLERLKAVLGGRDVRLAAEAEIASWFKGCAPGNVPPVRLRADQRIIMDRSLAHLGKILFAAGTAEDAVMATQMRPAAILLDLMLPDMPGFEVYEQLRRTGPLKRIPFIVISALDDEASRQRGRRLGAEGYLTKPFLPDTLVAAVQGLLADAQV